jgi:hypothetical protein
MSKRRNVETSKCRNVETSKWETAKWRNVETVKCRNGEMSKRRNGNFITYIFFCRAVETTFSFPPSCSVALATASSVAQLQEGTWVIEHPASAHC